MSEKLYCANNTLIKSFYSPGSSFYPHGTVFIGAPSLWQQGYTGVGVKVALLDSGIAQHQCLEGSVVERKCFCPQDHVCIPHGTSVASIISAKADNQGMAGIAPNAQLYDLQVIGCRTGTSIAFVEGLDYAVEQDVDVINMSLGMENTDHTIYSAIKRAYNKGIILVAASGNEGKGTRCYPGAFDEVLAVGNFDHYAKHHNPSSSATDNLTAPGTSIVCAGFNNDYLICTGTSMAAPHVSGMAALLSQKYNYMSKERRRDKIYSELQSSSIMLCPVNEDSLHGAGTLCYDKYCLRDFPAVASTKYFYYKT